MKEAWAIPSPTVIGSLPLTRTYWERLRCLPAFLLGGVASQADPDAKVDLASFDCLANFVVINGIVISQRKSVVPCCRIRAAQSFRKARPSEARQCRLLYRSCAFADGVDFEEDVLDH